MNVEEIIYKQLHREKKSILKNNKSYQEMAEV